MAQRKAKQRKIRNNNYMTKNFFKKLLQENPRLTHNSTILPKNLSLLLTNTLIIEKKKPFDFHDHVMQGQEKLGLLRKEFKLFLIRIWVCCLALQKNYFFDVSYIWLFGNNK